MNVGEDTDIALVRRWAAGDRDAGGEFAKRHFSTLWTYFRNKVPEAPDDLIQATLVQCQRFTDDLARARNLRAYLLAIARSQLRDYYRAYRPSAELEDASIRDLGSTLGTKLARQQQQETIARALQHLSHAHQEILELHYWNELSVTDIADVLGVPAGTVKSRLRRARDALAELVAPLAESLDASLRMARPSQDGSV